MSGRDEVNQISGTQLSTPLKFIGVLSLIVLIPYIIAVVLVSAIWTMVLYIAIWILWIPNGLSVLFIHSNSPVWSGYLEKNIFPHIEHRAVLLNWSERNHWKTDLAVRAFRNFGGRRNFNPMAIVFRPFRFQKSFRFYEAFRDDQHGNPESLERMKLSFFECLGIHENSH